MNSHALALTAVRNRCESSIQEIRELLNTIDKNLQVPGLAKRIDTFFYFEANRQLLMILDNLEYCWELDDSLLIRLTEIQQLVRTQWQKDYMLIACPQSLHAYLT